MPAYFSVKSVDLFTAENFVKSYRRQDYAIVNYREFTDKAFELAFDLALCLGVIQKTLNLLAELSRQNQGC